MNADGDRQRSGVGAIVNRGDLGEERILHVLPQGLARGDRDQFADINDPQLTWE